MNRSQALAHIKPLLAGCLDAKSQLAIATLEAPIAMHIHCPRCNEQHIDEGDFATKPHHTHACQHCGLVWRLAIEHTIGVKFLPGFKNDPPVCVSEAPPDEAMDQAVKIRVATNVFIHAANRLAMANMTAGVHGVQARIKEFDAAQIDFDNAKQALLDATGAQPDDLT